MGIVMTYYRCVVVKSTGNFVPYSGLSLETALNALHAFQAGNTMVVERRDTDGWQVIVGVYRTCAT